MVRGSTMHKSSFCIGFHNVFLMLDVLRAGCSSNGKTSKKLLFWSRKSRPGASQGGAGDQVWVPKRPSRAKKRARSAFGASENSQVSANEATSSEKARPVPPKSERGPERSHPELEWIRVQCKPLLLLLCSDVQVPLAAGTLIAQGELRSAWTLTRCKQSTLCSFPRFVQVHTLFKFTLSNGALVHLYR